MNVAVFSWEGQPIEDPERWAKDNDYLMVDIFRQTCKRTAVEQKDTLRQKLAWWLFYKFNWQTKHCNLLITNTCGQHLVESMPSPFWENARIEINNGNSNPIDYWTYRSPQPKEKPSE